MSESLGTARIDITADASGVISATDTAKRSISSMSADAQKEYQKLNKAERRRVDTLIQQADKLNMTKAQQIAYNATLRGVPTAVLDDLIKKLTASGSAAQAATGQMQQYGMSAKATAAAMRGVPAQLTDIVVSLQGGQRPMTVLLQQGGQLKDMFGGIVPAAKALATTVARMVNPFTVAAVAVGSLAFAYYKGANEMNDFRNHLIMTGGAIGVSVDQVSKMAASLDKIGGTRGNAVEVLTKLAGTGKIAGDQLENVAGVAIKMHSVLGVEIDDIVKDFAKLADEPSKAAAELNEKYHFLTASVYEQIVALEKQGKMQEAAGLAMQTFADESEERLTKVTENVGYLEKAWNGVKSVASEAFDIMKSAGRENTLSVLLEKAEKDLKTYEALGNGRRAEKAQEAREHIKTLNEKIQAEKEAARAEKAHVDTQEASVAAIARINKMMEDGASKSDKLKKALKEYHDQLDAIRKVNPKSELLDGEAIKKAEAAISAKYKEKSGRSGSAAIAAGIKILQNLREQGAALQAQLASVGILTNAEKERAKFEQQIADLKVKKVLTADEKSLLSQQSTLRVQHERNIALEKEVRHKEELLKAEERYQQILAQIQSSSHAQQEQYERQLGTYGKGDKEQERVESQRNIYREFKRYQDELAKATPESELGSAKYRAQSAEIHNELQKRLESQREYYAKVDALESNWSLGAQHAMTNYADQAKNVFSSVGSAVSSAFKGMEDALVTFVKTGKLNFSDFADSIISDMVRIMVQQSITGPLASALGSAVSGFFNSGAASPTPATNEFGGNYIMSAKGNVFDSPSLSAYSEGIYNTPKYFEFAKGAGVFGEAGPEAIMPLKRAADGSLGVRAQVQMAQSASHSGIEAVQINITNNSSQPVAARETGRSSAVVDGLKQMVVSVILEDQQRSGVITKGFKGVLGV